MQRQRLPIFKNKDHIIYLLEKYQTLVLVGETGCGKSTQVPQVRFECVIYIFKITQSLQCHIYCIHINVSISINMKINRFAKYLIKTISKKEKK